MAERPRAKNVDKMVIVFAFLRRFPRLESNAISLISHRVAGNPPTPSTTSGRARGKNLDTRLPRC